MPSARVVAVASLAALLAPVVPARGAPPVTAPVDTLCTFVAFSDPTAEPDIETGALSGGPLTLPGFDVESAAVGSGTLVCRIQVNVESHQGAGPQVSGHGPGVVTAGPAQVSYVATPADSAYLCAEFLADATGMTYYYDAVHHLWSTDPSVSCDLALNLGTLAPDDIDGTVCPLLAAVFPPDGDVPGWDCPPYGNRRSPGNGNANGRGKHTPGPPPEDPPPTPYYPKGTVKISSAIPGQVTFDYSNFTPPLAQWQCTEGATSVTCTPPAAATGSQNVCGTVAVSALSQATGVVTGDTRCPGTQNGASAVSTGPATTASSQSAAQDTDFPWTCDAAPAQSIGLWQVTCTVG